MTKWLREEHINPLICVLGFFTLILILSHQLFPEAERLLTSFENIVTGLAGAFVAAIQGGVKKDVSNT